jgi:hypothetical protein
MNALGQERARSLETAITEVRGVRRARVESTEQGIDSIRVLVIPERRSADIIEEVQRLAADRAMSIDASKVQIIRVEGGGPAQRRRLTSLSTERTRDRFRAKVMLELSGDVLVGESEVPLGVDFERRSMVKAVLEGMDELLEFPVEIEAAYILDVGARRIALVTLTKGSDILVGSAVITSDERDSFARATLDALNRIASRALEIQAASRSASSGESSRDRTGPRIGP